MSSGGQIESRISIIDREWHVLLPGKKWTVEWRPITEDGSDVKLESWLDTPGNSVALEIEFECISGSRWSRIGKQPPIGMN